MRSQTFIVAVLIAAAGSLLSQNRPPLQGFGPPRPSEELAKEPQTPGAKGDQQRHYYFADAKQEMPYRLYIPQSYDGKAKLPLVVALHGYGGNQDYFSALVQDLPALCEKHGFAFVAPMGYSVSGWYGAPLDIPGDRGRNGKQPPPPVTQTPAEIKRERDLSEADVMNVLALIRKEYKIDSNRTYLMGHSMGGLGTFFLGQKHASEWAAIAPMSGAMSGVDYSLSKLAKVPVMVSVGSTETATAETGKALVETMKGMGMQASHMEIEGGTHMSMIAPSVPKIFEFFDAFQ